MRDFTVRRINTLALHRILMTINLDKDYPKDEVFRSIRDVQELLWPRVLPFYFTDKYIGVKWTHLK